MLLHNIPFVPPELMDILQPHNLDTRRIKAVTINLNMSKPATVVLEYDDERPTLIHQLAKDSDTVYQSRPFRAIADIYEIPSKHTIGLKLRFEVGHQPKITHSYYYV